MSVVKINKFSGGMAEDVREKRTDTFAVAKNFNTFDNDFLKPYRITESESLSSGTFDGYRLTDTVSHMYTLGADYYQGLFNLGQVGVGDDDAKIFNKAISSNVQMTASYITSNIAGSTTGEDTTDAGIAQTLVSYNKKLYFLKTNSTSTVTLMQYENSSNTLSSIGTIIGAQADMPFGVSGTIYPKPFVHPKTGVMYVAAGGKISSYTQSGGLIANPIVIPGADQVIVTSMCDWGGYLAIALTSRNIGGASRVVLWDMSSSLVNDVIDFGEGALMVIENLGGVIIGLSADSTGGTSDFSTSPRIVMRGYSGGTSQVLKSFNSSSVQLKNFKQKQNDKLYFIGKMVVQGVTTFQVFVCGKNRSGNWFLNPDRLINNDTAVTDIVGFNLIGDYLWSGYVTAGVYYFVRTENDSTFTSTSIYESLINHGMADEDRTKKKTLKAISVAKTTTTGQLVLKYRIDTQNSANWVTICTLTASTKLNMKAVRESTGAPLGTGYEFQFRVESTNGGELVEIKYDYEVIKELI